MSNEQNSTFRHSEASMSILPLSTEALLFHDILEEKSLALRNALEEFLKSHTYGLFNSEFSIFLNRLKRIGNVERNINSNASRSTTMAESIPVNSRPNPTLNMSNANSSQVNMAGSSPVNSRPNPTSNMSNANNNNANSSQINMAGSSSVNSRPNSTSNTSNANNNNANSSQIIGESSFEPNLFRPHLGDISKTHYPIILTEERFIKKQPPVSINNNAASQLTQNQLDEEDEEDEGDEKYLNKWCVKLEEIKSDSGSTFIVKLIGVLVKKDLVKVLEKNHCAGILKFRKNKNLVQTDKGLYNLIGPIWGGMPNNLFQRCLKAKGIPRTWKHFLTKFHNFRIFKKKVPVNLNKSFTRSGTIYNKKNITSGIKKSNKKQKHSEDKGSNLKKIKSDNTHKELSIASTSTKFNGTTTSVNQKTNKRQKSSEDGGSNLKKIKNDNIHKELSIASTSKKFNGINISGDQKTNKQQNISEDEVSYLKKIKNDNIRTESLIASASKTFNKISTPTQYLKYKFHQKLVKTCCLMTKTAAKMGIN